MHRSTDFDNQRVSITSPNDDSAEILVDNFESARASNPSGQSSSLVDQPQKINDESSFDEFPVDELLIDESTDGGSIAGEVRTNQNANSRTDDDVEARPEKTNGYHGRDHIYDDSNSDNDLDAY